MDKDRIKKLFTEAVVAAMESCENEGASYAAPLYHRYGGRMAAQPVYLQIYKDEIDLAYSGEVENGVSPDDWYHRRWSIKVPPAISFVGLGELLNDGVLDQVADHVKTILWGHHFIEVNGNKVGVWRDEDDGFMAANDALEELFATCEQAEVYDNWRDVAECRAFKKDGRWSLHFYCDTDPDTVLARQDVDDDDFDKAALKLERAFDDVVVHERAEDFIDECRDVFYLHNVEEENEDLKKGRVEFLKGYW